jgi:hypothetical protein
MPATEANQALRDYIKLALAPDSKEEVDDADWLTNCNTRWTTCVETFGAFIFLLGLPHEGVIVAGDSINTVYAIFSAVMAIIIGKASSESHNYINLVNQNIGERPADAKQVSAEQVAIDIPPDSKEDLEAEVKGLRATVDLMRKANLTWRQSVASKVHYLGDTMSVAGIVQSMVTLVSLISPAGVSSVFAISAVRWGIFVASLLLGSMTSCAELRNTIVSMIKRNKRNTPAHDLNFVVEIGERELCKALDESKENGKLTKEQWSKILKVMSKALGQTLVSSAEKAPSAEKKAEPLVTVNVAANISRNQERQQLKVTSSFEFWLPISSNAPASTASSTVVQANSCRPLFN